MESLWEKTASQRSFDRLEGDASCDVLIIGGGLAGILCTWDCPCHGSRFAGDGKLIDNPATGDLKLSARQKERD